MVTSVSWLTMAEAFGKGNMGGQTRGEGGRVAWVGGGLSSSSSRLTLERDIPAVSSCRWGRVDDTYLQDEFDA